MLRWLLLILAVIVTAAFSVMNWGAFTTPTTLWLGFMMVEAPIGLVMLGLLLFFALLFGTWVIYLQGSALLDTRRHGRELQTQRDIADKAEASRFAELSRSMSSEFQRLGHALDTSQAATLARLGETEQRLAGRIDQAGNSLQASIAELDDRLERREAAGERLLPRG